MRALYSDGLPAFLSFDTPVDSTWPQWVALSRRLQRVSHYHKIIMIHQSFLGRSFKSPQYMYTRWASTGAAKNIIECMSTVLTDNEPQWWVEQAFVVTAGICLGLDVFHRPDPDLEFKENKSWVEKAILLLHRWQNSALASQGARLLTSLLNERAKRSEGARQTISTDNMGPTCIIQALSDAAEADANDCRSPTAVTQINSDVWLPENMEFDPAIFEQVMDSFPLEVGLDNNTFFGDFFTELF
ncbi:hypothetical protein GQ43DRAFT_439301 [Delitschia confertaspora ATCC 74209]|uniref:Transcription factor domain-containing protein n=1 Tax=Delitschia confertaspora ATCC 74209 TaxID=1513339 RepID=A0A9P4JR63_9PLEO|nr:hypothetical protein GQ43DRAFT_439301 [Delitschia confertaspora ATCC 74209]